MVATGSHISHYNEERRLLSRSPFAPPAGKEKDYLQRRSQQDHPRLPINMKLAATSTSVAMFTSMAITAVNACATFKAVGRLAAIQLEADDQVSWPGVLVECLSPVPSSSPPAPSEDSVISPLRIKASGAPMPPTPWRCQTCRHEKK